jgi:hypothetical protein
MQPQPPAQQQQQGAPFAWQSPQWGAWKVVKSTGARSPSIPSSGQSNSNSNNTPTSSNGSVLPSGNGTPASCGSGGGSTPGNIHSVSSALRGIVSPSATFAPAQQQPQQPQPLPLHSALPSVLLSPLDGGGRLASACPPSPQVHTATATSAASLTWSDNMRRTQELLQASAVYGPFKATAAAAAPFTAGLMSDPPLGSPLPDRTDPFTECGGGVSGGSGPLHSISERVRASSLKLQHAALLPLHPSPSSAALRMTPMAPPLGQGPAHGQSGPRSAGAAAALSFHQSVSVGVSVGGGDGLTVGSAGSGSGGGGGGVESAWPLSALGPFGHCSPGAGTSAYWSHSIAPVGTPGSASLAFSPLHSFGTPPISSAVDCSPTPQPPPPLPPHSSRASQMG